MKVIIYFTIGVILGYIVGAISYEPNEEVVSEIINSVKEQPKMIDSAGTMGKSLGMYFWHLGYRQGADAAIKSIENGNIGNFSKQMELDSLNLELTINAL